MTPLDLPKTLGTGIVVGELGVSALKCSLSGQSYQAVDWAPDCPPPSILLPRFPHEPHRFERPQSGKPCHPRGSGCDWPPEAQVDDQRGSGRLPLALAWTKLPREPKATWEWEIDNYRARATPASAIATAAANVLSQLQPVQNEERSVLVIPNATLEESQQAILDEARRLKINIHLLWRPVAAALAWCNHFGDEFRDQVHVAKESVGHLLCLHLGLSGIEATFLELLTHDHSGRRWLVPARSRPDRTRPEMTGPGWLALTSNATEFLSSVHLPADRQHLWQLIFATPWANAVLSGLSGSRVEMPSGAILESRPERICLDALPQREADRSWEILGNWRVPLVHPDSLDAWCSRMTADMPNNVVGAVVTGEIAPLAVRDGRTLGRSLLQTFGVCQRTRLVEAPNESDTLLAQGASLFGARLAAGIPAYFDTLPKLLMLVRERYGDMQWIPLLEGVHKFAAGGEVWKRPQPVSGLAIEKRAEQLTFAVHHEEYSNIRELPVPLPNGPKTDEPIELHVSITPAQGHARLEVIPERRDLFGHRRVFVDWNRMKTVPDEKWGNDRNAYKDHQPHPYPPLMPRMHSRARWNFARLRIRQFLAANDQMSLFQDDTAMTLEAIKKALRQPDQAEQGIHGTEVRAVSSDGTVPTGADQVLLDRLIDRLLSCLRQTKDAQEEAHILRSLAYVSADRTNFSDFLIGELEQIVAGAVRGSYRTAVLLACGNCLRKPEHAGILARHFVAYFEGEGTNHRDWLQAMQTILRYRKDATRVFDNSDCVAIVDKCWSLLQQQLDRANRNETPRPLIFARAAGLVALLLRRRVFDPEFLDPETDESAQRVKKTCLAVMKLIEQHEDSIRTHRAQIEHGNPDWHVVNQHWHAIRSHESVIRAFVGRAQVARQAIQQVIDYIDRRGIGLLQLAGPDD
jgi:hypothetical protein